VTCSPHNALLASLVPTSRHLLCALPSFLCFSGDGVCFSVSYAIADTRISSINFPLFLLLLRLRWCDCYLSLSTTEHGCQLDIKFISLSIHFSRPLFFSLFFSLPRTFYLGVVWTCLAPFHGLLLKVASSQTETCTSHFSQIFYLYISSSLRCFRY
jgi:hypothetical protein